jgi:hypothetical protein
LVDLVVLLAVPAAFVFAPLRVALFGMNLPELALACFVML